MQVNIKGVLPDPTNTALANQEVRITREGDSIYTSVHTDTSGAYDFTLVYGTYLIELYIKDSYMAAGTVLVDQGLPSEVTLQELFGYSVFINPEGILTLPVFWQDSIASIVDGVYSRSRESRDQIVDTNVHIGDVKTTSVTEDGLARYAENTFDMSACNARIGTEAIVYSDSDGNLTANQGNLITTGSSTVSNVKYLTDNIKDSTITSTDILTKDTEVNAHTSVSESTKYSVGDSVSSDEYLYMDTSDILSTAASVIGNTRANTSNSISINEANSVNVYIVGNSMFKTTSTITGSSIVIYTGSEVAGKVSSVTYSNDGATTTEDHLVDVLRVSREGNTLLEVNNVTNTVSIKGKLRVTALEDEDGNPIKPEDGDTIFQVYQYSDTSIGPWGDTLQSYHVWKRENYSINGYVDPEGWGTPYRFVPEQGEPGQPGDTIYEETQYSVDGISNWHTGILAGDKWRRTRTVINSVAGEWSEPVKITGDDGSTIETRSVYSLDGVYNWHSVLDPLDKYERRAVFIDGVQEGPWSDPFAIGKGADGEVGPSGSGWHTIVGRGGVFPADALATVDFINEFGRSPVLDDHLTYVDVAMPNTTHSEIKRCNSPAGSTVTWSTPTVAMNGGTIIRGTLSADRIVADTITGNLISSKTTVIAGSGSWTAGMNGDDSATAGNYQYWRFWAGATNPAIAPYRVDRDGNLFADSGRFRGKVELIGSAYMTITSSDGFGSSNQFLEWTGPKSIDSKGNPIMADVRELNAIKYFKTNGKAYFGGGITAGDFRNAITSTENSATATTPSLVFGSNGGLIDIVLTGNNSGDFSQQNTPAAGSGVTSFTIFLEKKISGSWVSVATLNGTGKWTVIAEGTDRLGDSYCMGSLTYTDSDRNTSQREYRARMTTRTVGSVPVKSQQISIVTAEVN